MRLYTRARLARGPVVVAHAVLCCTVLPLLASHASRRTLDGGQRMCRRGSVEECRIESLGHMRFYLAPKIDEEAA